MLCDTDWAGVQPICCRPSPRTRDFDLAAKRPHAALVCRLMVFTLAIYVITWITSHLPTRRDGGLSWPDWLTRSGHFTHKVITCQPQIRRRSEKVRQPKTDVQTTELRRLCCRFYSVECVNWRKFSWWRWRGPKWWSNVPACKFPPSQSRTSTWTQISRILYSSSTWYVIRLLLLVMLLFVKRTRSATWICDRRSGVAGLERARAQIPKRAFFPKQNSSGLPQRWARMRCTPCTPYCNDTGETTGSVKAPLRA